MKIGYARVSTKDQNLGLQIDALTKAGCEKIYQDIASGARSERPALNEMIHNLRPGDVLVIWKLDRLGRSLNHLISLVNDLMEKRSACKACTIPLTPPRPKAG
jgi:DNA invertase Pin-like site-specific DNA recombinase